MATTISSCNQSLSYFQDIRQNHINVNHQKLFADNSVWFSFNIVEIKGLKTTPHSQKDLLQRCIRLLRLPKQIPQMGWLKEKCISLLSWELEV